MVDEFGSLLERQTERSNPLKPVKQILMALRFYASGGFHYLFGDIISISQPSMSRNVSEVTDILYEKACSEIRMPQSQIQLANAAREFAGIVGFPRLIGTIDGAHIDIKAPSRDEHLYINRKGFHSLNLQMTCSARFIILDFCVRFPGESHESHIWSMSNLKAQCKAGKFGNLCLLGEHPFEYFKALAETNVFKHIFFS